MGVKIKTVKNDFPLMEKSLEKLHGKKVNVGHLDGGEQAWLAGIHEYGCKITVTPKMRNWLAANGLHLKKTTTQIVIPERSFLRAGFDEHHEDVVKKFEKALGKVLLGGDVDKYLEDLGQLLRDKIVDYGIELSEPPKHPFTLRANPTKTNPLVQSGEMLEALTFEVVD